MKLIDIIKEYNIIQPNQSDVKAEQIGNEIYITADSGEYYGDIKNDDTVIFTVVFSVIRDNEEFTNDNWKEILGPKHAFTQIINKIGGDVQAMDDYVAIKVNVNDLLNKFK